MSGAGYVKVPNQAVCVTTHKGCWVKMLDRSFASGQDRVNISERKIYVPVKSKLQHPPGHLTPLPSWGVGNLIPMPKGWGIGLDVM